MSKQVCHIWAKPNQYIKVHRRRKGPGDGDDLWFAVIIAIIVLIWIAI